MAFLVTVSAQLAGYISYVQTAGMISDLGASELGAMTLNGVLGAAPGVAIGTAIVVLSADLDAIPDREIEDIEKEIQSLEDALASTRLDILRLKSRLDKTLLPEEQNLFDAYLSMLDSKSIKRDIIALIQEGHCMFLPYAKLLSARFTNLKPWKIPICVNERPICSI